MKLVFESAPTSAAASLYKVLLDGKHIAWVSKGLVTQKITVRDAEDNYLAEFPTKGDESQEDAVEAFLHARFVE